MKEIKVNILLDATDRQCEKMIEEIDNMIYDTYKVEDVFIEACDYKENKKDDYVPELLSEELDKYKKVVFDLVSENMELKSKLKMISEDDFTVEISKDEFERLQSLEEENRMLKEDNDRIENNCLLALNYENKALNEAIKYKNCLQRIKKLSEEEFNKKLEDKDCFDCDSTFNTIITIIRDVFNEMDN